MPLEIAIMLDSLPEVATAGVQLPPFYSPGASSSACDSS
jgi:hypothetical protein